MKVFTVLLLLAFVAFGVYLAFFMDGVCVTENGREVGSMVTLVMLLWLLFPRRLNKLLLKALNRRIRDGAIVSRFAERCKEQNVPDITVNGVNLLTVMAAVDLVRDSINGE